MKRPHPDLPRYTWDQAELCNLWPANAFTRTLGLNPANVRRWASRGRIHPAGVGPNGSVLYHYDEVIQYAATHARSVA